MDDRGRLAQSMTRLTSWRLRSSAAPARSLEAMAVDSLAVNTRHDLTRKGFVGGRAKVRRIYTAITKFRPARGIGTALASALIMGSLTYGMVKGDHVAVVVAGLTDVRDSLANTAGFRI